MTDGVHTSVNPVQAAGCDPRPDRRGREPDEDELPERNHAVLSRGQAADRAVNGGA